MKKLPILLILLFASTAFGEPFLTCDPQPDITKYRMAIPAISYDEESIANADGSGNHDLGTLPVGEHNGEFYAGAEWVLDGVPQGIWRWSDPTPFLLRKPAASEPDGNRIVLP